MLEGNKEDVVIDTNLLVRYLTEDDPQKAKAVDALLNSARKGEIKILIPSIVIAELVWVLESFYKMTADDVAGLVEAILNTPGIDTQDKSVIKAALKLYRSKKIDLIDGWIIEFAKVKGAKKIYTFDKKHFKDAEPLDIVNP
ncbi:MAG TPA: type II toxin-antitoxin system VapC family toxin [Thermodesulfobacteriota bacterium]|nr:type II toxin-antitoxin system VapC family toxin [Thermodesulfobacteriota bacterium]